MSMYSELRMPKVSDSSRSVGMEVSVYQADRRGRVPTAAACEESLIVDDRSTLSPAQAVENRLSRLLSNASMPISHLQMRGMLLRRS